MICEVLALKYGLSSPERTTAEWLLGLPRPDRSGKTSLESSRLRRLEQELVELHCQDPSRTADELINLGFPDDALALMELVIVPGFEGTVIQVSRISDLVGATEIICAATEKAAQFVVALQNVHEDTNPVLKRPG